MNSKSRMSKYFDSETNQYTAEFLAFDDAVCEKTVNYRPSQIAEALEYGMSVDEAVEMIEAQNEAG